MIFGYKIDMLLLSKYVVENQSNGLFNYTPDEKSFPVFSANNIFSKRAVKETIGFSSNNFTGSVA